MWRRLVEAPIRKVDQMEGSSIVRVKGDKKNYRANHE